MQEERNVLRKEGGISLRIVSLLLGSDFLSSFPSNSTNSCFFKQMRYPRLLTRCIDMFHISLCGCVCVCLSWETNGMPLVSTAEKSMTTQPFHLRNPMKGWAAAHVCLRMFMLACMWVFAHTTHKLVATAVKYAYLSANPHQRRGCSNLEVSISAG